MDIYKESPPVVLDAVQDADGVYRVPLIVVRWEAHYHIGIDWAIDDEIRVRIGEKMARDLEKMARDLFRHAASS
jgi:hypothetical protein